VKWRGRESEPGNSVDTPNLTAYSPQQAFSLMERLLIRDEAANSVEAKLEVAI